MADPSKNRANRAGSNNQGGQQPGGWLQGNLPNPKHGFQGVGRRSSPSVHARHSASPPRRPSLGQVHGRVSTGSPPELMINGAKTTAPSPTVIPGREALHVKQPQQDPASPWPLPPGAPLNPDAVLTATQVSAFKTAVNLVERPREVQQIVETQVVAGRPGQEAAEALAGSLQEAVSKRDAASKEEILQAKVQAVQQFANPHIPNCDPDEPDVRQPRLPAATGIHRPRFDRVWVEALTNPARAVEEAARRMFAERVVVEHGNLQLGELNTRLEQATRDAARPPPRLTPAEIQSRPEWLRVADREFAPKLTIPPNQDALAATAANVVTTSITGRPEFQIALIYTECVGRVKVANTGSLLPAPASLSMLPYESSRQISAFLRLRGLPMLETPHYYEPFLSPGVFIDGSRTQDGGEWAQTANATLVLQRKQASRPKSATGLELELTRIRDTVRGWIPLFRAYLGEYADLLGAMAMETPPHIDPEPVCASVYRDFWPADLERPDPAVMRGLWGEREEHYGFHMNMALLTSLVVHASKMEVAMDELEMRWVELLTAQEKEQEEEFRNLIKEIEPLTHKVEMLLCGVADREHAESSAAAEDREIVELIRRKEAAENKMAVVDPLIYSIWSRQLLEQFRTVVADRVSEVAMNQGWNQGMPHLTRNFCNVVEKWNAWCSWIKRTPEAMGCLATLDIDDKELDLTVINTRHVHNARATLQFMANNAAHRVVHPWIAEAASSSTLSYMAEDLKKWFHCVYNDYDFTIENSRRYFVPDFDVKSDPLDHYWDGTP